MANFLTTFSQREILTASKLNDIVNLVNDHERRLLAQKITSGTGYTFTQSQGGTSLQITPSASAEDGDNYAYSVENGDKYVPPFKVSIGEDEGGATKISIHEGTIFGVDGNCASFEQVNEQTIDPVADGTLWLVCAKLRCKALATLPTREDGDETDNSALAVAIPFSATFVEMCACDYETWRANSLGSLGQESADGSTGEGLDGTWNIYFPIAFVQNGEVSQILHSDIFWNGHWTRSI